uniref:G-protein coupled receptors family 1 profile domain-containing protein n=1 Tax=Naja naja TaxID=35670 RepID=A0A8C6XC55_NAJNA
MYIKTLSYCAMGNSTFSALLMILHENISFYRELRLNDSFSEDNPSLKSLQEWIVYPPYFKLKMFLIPPIICLLAAILVIPFILFVIFSHVNIRQETRYLLLGNALVSDLMYLLGCIMLLFLLAMTYCGGLLTSAAMVLDTYLAILWPLHYISILPYSRAKKMILFLWICSGIFPGIVFLILHITQDSGECPVENCSVPIILAMTLQGKGAMKFCYILSVSALFICLSLILCGYMVLYFKTKQSGIWRSIFSRASVTFIMHHIILFFHFSPLLAVVVESLLYVNAVIGPKTEIWVSMIVCNVLITLPKALLPYLCGLRYREISSSLKLCIKRKRSTVVAPTTFT